VIIQDSDVSVPVISLASIPSPSHKNRISEKISIFEKVFEENFSLFKSLSEEQVHEIVFVKCMDLYEIRLEMNSQIDRIWEHLDQVIAERDAVSSSAYAELKPQWMELSDEIEALTHRVGYLEEHHRMATLGLERLAMALFSSVLLEKDSSTPLVESSDDYTELAELSKVCREFLNAGDEETIFESTKKYIEKYLSKFSPEFRMGEIEDIIAICNEFLDDMRIELWRVQVVLEQLVGRREQVDTAITSLKNFDD